MWAGPASGHVDPKCGTPEAVRLFVESAGKVAARPSKQAFAISDEGHFRVHYDTTGYHAPDMTDLDGDGLSDWVDSTCVYMEYAWDLMVDELGYDPPLSDDGRGGGDEVDVYIQNYGAGGYGATTPDMLVDGGATSYISIDNDFSGSQYATNGYEALRVTTAHEFFHTIHFSYKFFGSTGMGLLWWMEHSSVWMEERAWDDVNDYLAYIKFFFGYQTYDQRNYALDSNSGIFKYGAAIWAMFLAKQYGDDGIRLIWETLRDEATPGIDDFETPILQKTAGQSGLDEALRQFAAWNWFTGIRGNPAYYPDSESFGIEMSTDLSWGLNPGSDMLSIKNLTSRYIELLFVGDWEDGGRLDVAVTPLGSGEAVSSVILYDSPTDHEIYPVADDGTSIHFDRHRDRGVLVTTCTNTTAGDYAFSLDAEMHTVTDVDGAGPLAFALDGVYPNPFNPSTTVSFTVPRRMYVSVRVYNTAGQLVDTLLDETMDPGMKRLFWRPSGLAGGTYFVRVSTADGHRTVKALFLK